MQSKVRRVVEALPRRPGELRDLRSRLGRAYEALAHWKLRSAHHCATVDRLQQTIDTMRVRMHELQVHAAIRKHGELSHAVLAQILPVRVGQRPVLASDVTAAQERERHLLAVSPEYRAALHDDGSRAERVQREEVSGIPWWLPCDAAAAGRIDKLRQHGFPLRAILQTREVALGGVMLDLGANVGRTSIPRALLGDVRAVYAAEPEPTNYEALVQNVIEHRLRGMVLPDRIAVGASRGEVQLRRSEHIGGHRVLAGGRRLRAGVETVTVQLWPVDDWMARLGVEPEAVSFVKVDTQGSEVSVLRGATALLARRHVAWQIEVDPALLTHAGVSVAELLGLLSTHFTHFIDIGTRMTGRRTRPTGELGDALAYVGTAQSKTDLVVYNAAEGR